MTELMDKSAEGYAHTVAGWRIDVKHAEDRVAEAEAELVSSRKFLAWTRSVLAELEKAHPEAVR